MILHPLDEPVSGVLDEATTVRAIIYYYQEQKTIEKNEANRLVDLTRSPDKENLEVVKTILQQKYKIL